MPPIFGIPILLFLFYITSNYIISEFEKGEYIYLFLGFLSLITKSDSDKTIFLRSCFKGTRFYIIRSIENCINTFPFIAICIINGKYFIGFTLFLIGILLSFFNFNKSIQFIIPTPFWKYPFEFTAGFRKQILVFLFAYLLVFIGIKVDNFNLIIFSILLISINCALFYVKSEPKYFVWIYNDSAEKFLRSKIKIIVFYIGILTLPITILTGIFYTDKLFILIIFQIIWSLNVILMLLIKYALYPSDTNPTQLILLFMSFTFPPFTLFFIYNYYKKALLNLKTYD